MPELASVVIQRRIITFLSLSLSLSLSLALSPLSLPLPRHIIDDHVDRSFVVRPMTWRSVITLCITLSRNELRPTRAGRLGASFIHPSDGRRVWKCGGGICRLF